MRSIAFSLLICLSISTPWLISCASNPQNQDHLEMAALWWQTSAESRALQLQAYRWAKMVLQSDLQNKSKKGKRAVVVDIDETVLDNGAYESSVVLSGKGYPERWAEWVEARQAAPVAGSLEFLKFADQKGVTIFYVTNRDEPKFKKATIDNLTKLGFPQVSETSVQGSTGEWNKEARRKKIRESYRIVLLVGDNLNDFTDDFAKKSVDDRFTAVEKLRSKWGEEFIVIPNPAYGDFEGAVYGFDWKKSPAEKRELRRKALKPF